MRDLDYDGLLEVIKQEQPFQVLRVEFVTPDDWVDNRGPKCRHVPKNGTDALAVQLAAFGGRLSAEALDDIRRVVDRDGFADIKRFWLV